MRRADKEIKDKEQLAHIISQCQVCRLGLAKDNIPYILPVSFGYDGAALYFHTAKVGRKIEFMSANPHVCFEFEHGVQPVPHGSNPCDWTFSFRSVIGYGTVQELTDPLAMNAGLGLIMKQYSPWTGTFTAESMAAIKVWKINIESMTGKQSKV
jgi:nitroimidazol reductase NimA-like FMN-containing flavoprotein (pyridoxamine 5'-phosphate oxidase superfamily)